jgi:hypothetical protein
MIVNNEFERIWKGLVVAYFTLLSQNLLGGTEEMCLGILCDWERGEVPVYIYKNTERVY